MEKRYIQNLTLFSSEGCNLKCSYCEVTKPQNEVIVEEIKQAFKNGEFLNNIKKTFEALNADPKNIKNLDLWGQEPTLTLTEFADFFPSLYELCPNINKLVFSTNAVDFIDRIVYLINILSKTITKDLSLDIQFSHDGTYSTEKYRQISSNTIINNIKYFIKSVNTLELNTKLTVNSHVHGVLTRDLMKYLIEDEQRVLDYWLEWKELSKEIESMILNPRLHFYGWTPAMETPANASKEEGQLLARFYLESVRILNKYNYNSDLCFSMPDQFLRTFRKGLFKRPGMGKSIENTMFRMAKYKWDEKKCIKYLSQGLFCGPFSSAIKIRYDGTLMHCQNVVHLIKEENCKRMEGQEYRMAEQMIKHRFYPNLAKNPEDLENYKIFERMSLYKESGYPQLLCNLINLMKILRDANQIDESYQNDEKLLRHAFMLSWFNNCLDAEYRLNGGALTKYIGFIRLHCNGFLDIVDDFYKKTEKEIKHRQAIKLSNDYEAEKRSKELI